MQRPAARSRPTHVDSSDTSPIKKRKRSRQRGSQSSLGRGLLLGATLTITVVVLLRARRTAPTHRVHQSHYVPDEALPLHLTSDDGCVEYGCPIYPSEFDDVAAAVSNVTSRADQSSQACTMATLTRMSNRHPRINQDSAVILRPFRTKQTTSDADFLVGVFDGHGRQGHYVSRFVRRAVPDLLATKLNSMESLQDDDFIIRALNESFVEADILAPPSNAMLGGTTATVTLRRGNKLFIANTGDSRTIVATATVTSNDAIQYMTRLDKAHLPEEQQRIEAAGGKVKYPPNSPQQSRVWVYSTAARETIGLAMSRSLGDWEWGAVGVIAEPIVDVLKLEANTSTLLLAASDGMWDMRARPQFFAKKFFLDSQQHPLAYCHDVMQTISPKNDSWYRDDVSMIVMKI